MYRVCIVLLSLIIVIGILAFGCSQKTSDPIIPQDNELVVSVDIGSESDRVLWGVWEIRFDTNELSPTIEPVREPQLHVDVADMVSYPACDDCIVLTVNSFNTVTRIIDVDVTLRNPYPISGKDVRGILFITGYEHILVNPDDWTDLWDIPGGIELNPFIAFVKDEPNRVFGGNAEHTENYQVYIPKPPSFFAIRYAVDASWPGNCKEPYAIQDFQQEVITTDYGSSGAVQVTVFDWQDDVDLVRLSVPEISGQDWLDMEPGAIDNVWWVDLQNNEFAYAGEHPAVIEATSTNSGGVALYDLHDIVISSSSDQGWARTWGGSSVDTGANVIVDDSGNIYVAGQFQSTVDFDPGAGYEEHTSNGLYDCFLSKFAPAGNLLWTRTWGGSGSDRVANLAFDDSGNVYITGEFKNTTDFDPGPGEQPLISSGLSDAYLCKLNASGDYQWACAWGGSESDEGLCVALDDMGAIYVSGQFIGTVDFDPGAGTESISSNGNEDAYVSKFDSTGGFVWAKTWGGSSDECARGVATDGSAYIYITGEFRGYSVDFDPDDVGIDEHDSNGSTDAYLSQLSLAGAHEWTITWGGGGPGYGGDYGWAVDTYGSSAIYVAGNFYGTVDFDPGIGTVEHSADRYGAFVSKFGPDGTLNWVSTWDGNDYESGGGIVALDMAKYVVADSFGDVVVTGQCNEGTDFDPGPGVNVPTLSGKTDAYLCKLNSSDGSLDWVRVFGGLSYDNGWGCAVDGESNAYVVGGFEMTVDFDPGAGVDEHTTNGSADVFLVKYNSDGNW